MASSRNARWLLVECGDGSCNVVNVRAVVNGAQELKIGDEVTVRGSKRLGQRVKVVSLSDDRKTLEQQVKVEDPAGQPQEGPSLYEDLEGGDYSPSGSSWGPGDLRPSSESEGEINNKRIKVETIKKQYSNKGSKVRTPTLRPEPVVPKSQPTLKRPQHFPNKVGKRKLECNLSMPVQQAIADSTRSQPYVSPSYHQKSQTEARTVNVSAEELTKVKNDLKQFKDILSSLKGAVASLRTTLSADHLYQTIYASKAQDPVSNVILPNDGGLIEVNLPRNGRRDDGPEKPIQAIEPIRYGLIKHNSSRAHAQPSSRDAISGMRRHGRLANLSTSSPESENSGDVTSEMVPIGSGKTLVPKAVYSSIDWNSYTMATRKLLMAVFPRKVLATHSLTGKASPAFTDKPAKLCLDPKKVSDVALEVTKKSKVKESLVRSAITTKCADEYKMFRLKCRKEQKLKSINKANYRLLKNQENLPPDSIERQTTDGFQSTSYNHTL